MKVVRAEAVAAVAVVALLGVVGREVLADDSPPDDRVNVTTEIIKGEDVFAWITVADGDDHYRCLLLVDQINNNIAAADAVAALWCNEVDR